MNLRWPQAALRWLLGVTICFTVSSPAASQPVLQLSSTTSTLSDGHMQMLRDSAGMLAPEQAAASPGWELLAGPLNAGYTRDVIWLRLRVQRPPTAQDSWLAYLSHALVDDVALFQRDQHSRWIEVARSGENMGRANWAVRAKNPVLQVVLETDEPVELLLRLHSKNAMSMYLAFATPSAFAEASQWEYFAYGLGFGFGLLLLVFHTLLWHVTREDVGAWYLIYVASALSVEALTVGLPQQYFDMPPEVSDPLLGILLSASLWIGSRFWLLQLDLRARWPRFSARLVGTALLVSVCGSALVAGGAMGLGMQLVQGTALAMIVLYVAICVYLFNRDDGQARVFLLIFGFYYLSVFISFSRNMGWIAATVFTNNAVAFGAGLHMVLMSLKLNRRYDKLRRAKELAQQRIMEMVARQNERLEVAVEARTVELLGEISRRENLERELRSALIAEQRAKQSQLDFVAMVSHEFRTPLAIIHTTAQQIARNADALREKTLKRCENLREAARRLSSLVDEYLTVDRIDAGAANFRPREYSPREVSAFMDAIVGEWPQARVNRTGICCLTSLSCDWGLMHVALRNLLANADRHTQPLDAIELSLEYSSERMLSFRVRNAGRAIPSDDVPHLFEKYFRGRNSLHSPGAGLGLYIVRQIAEMHGGQACLEACGMEGFIVFSINLPLAAVVSTSHMQHFDAPQELLHADPIAKS